MSDAPTHTDLFDAGRREAILAPTRFDRAIIDTAGSDVNVVINVGAAMAEEVTSYLQTALTELTLGNAVGEALDRLVYDQYQLRRKDAASAVATLQLSRSSSGTGFTVPQGSLFASTGGQTYQTQSAIAFGNGQNGPLEVVVVAVQTGPDGNAPAGTITTVQAALEDTTVTATNDAPAVGGRDQEDDEELLRRARAFFITARRGTAEAIEFGAQQVARVSQATATEQLNITTGLAGYRVSLIVSDPNGQANTALANEVEQSLDEYRALGVPVSVVPATPQYINITASGLLFASGANTADVLASANARILAAVNAQAPGATLRRADVLAALTGTAQLIVPEGALTAPAGDLVPTTGTIIRTTSDRIALNV